jgi:sporulation protein YlmC with PRC-barrel domain
MKLLNAFAIVAALGLANVACVQAQRTESPTQADSNGRKSAGSTDPSAASSLPQPETTSITAPERTTAGSSEASSASSAHQRDMVGFPRGPDGSASSLDTKWVSALVGMKVETPSGARLGTVKDVIVDGYGHQTYAIISYAGMMGLGNKYTAVPWVTVGEMLQRDRLLMDQGQLENAPLLSSAKPDSTNRSWRREADSYWRGKLSLGAGSANVPAEPNARAPVSQPETPPKERR